MVAQSISHNYARRAAGTDNADEEAAMQGRVVVGVSVRTGGESGRAGCTHMPSIKKRARAHACMLTRAYAHTPPSACFAPTPRHAWPLLADGTKLGAAVLTWVFDF